MFKVRDDRASRGASWLPIVLFLLVLPLGVGVRGTGAAQDASRILSLAADGDVDEAWRLWAELVDGVPKQRLGLDLSIATGELARAMEFYEALTGAGREPDREALQALMLGVGADLAETASREAVLVACGAVVVVRPAGVRCRSALESIAREAEEPSQRAVAAYALANAGIDDSGIALPVDPSLPTRMRIAQTMLRLPSVERLALLGPAIASEDPATQYQALLVAATIPGPEVLAVLRSLQVTGFARNGLLVALVRHGDLSRLPPDVDLSAYGGYERAQLGRGLIESLDQRGLDVLTDLSRSRVDAERLAAAEALARINADLARRVITDLLQTGGPAIESRALHVAGLVGMGADPWVYRRLVGGADTTRAFAVEAVANTLVPLPPAPIPAMYR